MKECTNGETISRLSHQNRMMMMMIMMLIVGVRAEWLSVHEENLIRTKGGEGGAGGGMQGRRGAGGREERSSWIKYANSIQTQ